MTQKTLVYDDLLITLEDVFEAMGYHGEKPDEGTCRETIALISEVRPWLRPRYCYQVIPALPDFDMGRIIQRQLQGAEAYACFICTSGQEFEAYQQRLKQEDDMVRVFVADALGTVIAERCADQMEKDLQLSIDKLGWHHTNRFSPGYCGWHVSQQQLLFPLFKGQTCGVCLNDSSLMVPIKSVSGIVGLGTTVRHLDYTCGLCDYQQCYRRRRRS